MHGYDQDEVSLVHVDTIGWCHLFVYVVLCVHKTTMHFSSIQVLQWLTYLGLISLLSLTCNIYLETSSSSWQLLHELTWLKEPIEICLLALPE